MIEVQRSLSTPKKVSHLFSVCLICFLGVALSGIAVVAFEKMDLDQIFRREDWFQLREVKIVPEWPLTVRRVQSWLPSLSGKNLVTLDAGKIIATLSQKPWVENVAVKKEYPNRLVIDVETKRPSAITLLQGEPYFLDSQGQVIEKAAPQLLRVIDLPFVSNESASTSWNVGKVIAALSRFKETTGPNIAISEVSLGAYPYFKIFLSHPKLEVLLNFENWETQLPIFNALLHRPPSQVGQLQRINLVFPKKAVVSSSLSH